MRFFNLVRDVAQLRSDVDRLDRRLRLAIGLIRLQRKKIMSLENDLSTLDTAEKALEAKEAADAAKIAEQSAEIDSLKSQIVPGTVLTDDQAAAIHALADKYSALAGLTPTPATDPAPATTATDAPSA